MAKKSGNILHFLLRICFLALPALCILHTVANAQDSTKAEWLKKQQPDNRKDSAQLFITKKDSSAVVKKDSVGPIVQPPIHSPRKAALYSAVLPGLGQIYNREYWKLPLVYAAMGITTYTYIFNMNKYRTYRDAYRIRMDGNADTVDDYVGLYSDAGLKYLRDGYREYVDYSVLVFVLAYGLNILDATVFAHLRNFDMSDDLSMKITPTVIDNRALGVSVKINLGGSKRRSVSSLALAAPTKW
ncbi:DUF5683 domain-containing protein [Chitinophaga sancti]|uniref:DUF5683 domain-containing protein n=1 Tax=Chitinophaga sancti TaxID=1004 RepID=UPI002A74C904|nr:DUF5683 domain-containing protein [Chitinophaga sancti]WPQ65477.1 DUF5683 domain-containing protein [Chitinophaga sancti]